MLCTYWQTHLSSCDLYNQVQVLSTVLIRHLRIPNSSTYPSLCSVAIKIIKLFLSNVTYVRWKNIARERIDKTINTWTNKVTVFKNKIQFGSDPHVPLMKLFSLDWAPRISWEDFHSRWTYKTEFYISPLIPSLSIPSMSNHRKAVSRIPVCIRLHLTTIRPLPDHRIFCLWTKNCTSKFQVCTRIRTSCHFWENTLK